jgi:hypothetical protein
MAWTRCQPPNLGKNGHAGPTCHCYKRRMPPFAVHPVSPELEVRVSREMPRLAPALETRSDTRWARASARVEAGGAGRMFNGQVFSIDAITPERITGHLSEYRRLVAQIEDNALFADLGVRSLAACGVLRCADGVVFGRRPSAAIYQASLWQPCPAGSVDGGARGLDGTMDYRAQLLTELREELGLGAEVISDITPLCVVEHAGSHVCDLGMAVRTTLSADAIQEAHRVRGNAEYDPLRIIPVADLCAFISWAGASLVPQAPPFLAHAGLLPHCPRRNVTPYQETRPPRAR